MSKSAEKILKWWWMRELFARSLLLTTTTMANTYNSHSPPPLRHPVPTHPAYIPEPPSTPVSPQGYQRFTSSPTPPQSSSPPQHQAQYTHVPAYTSPFQHSQQHQQQQPIPQHPHAQASFVPQPNMAAWGMNDATTQLGFQLGQSAVAAGQDYVQRNVRI